ncbi:Molybdopterin molybdenumtransferase [Oligella urethralis]|uniref:molybdopterin molybdotransferase MoeA n=1 Tax=Oligella urethralis TaxID=90245 RepID=UPI0029586083|nr:gephyrin-like molybdotransferase Glp [Oligella urethralis]WOS37479.1 Molybdopterin molybdenumtransferase [Oligella urethralis]
MRDYYDALNDLLSNALSTQDIEEVPLEQAVGRILAKDLLVQYPAPQFDNSAMDGYAVNDMQRLTWEVIGTIAAGDESAQFDLKPGQAVRILTGAGMPKHCDSVIQQELVERDGDRISIKEAFAAGKNIRYMGEELQQGEVLLDANRAIRPAAIGLLASQGYATVPCFAKLKLTVFSTGDELTPLGQALAINQIYDSNRPMLLSFLKRYRFLEISSGGAIEDKLETLKTRISEAASTQDVLIFTGGASVGEKDYLKQALEELGEIEHWKLAIKPGKPFGWGKVGTNTKVFLLPGNPVASYATTLLLALPAMKRIAGVSIDKAKPFSFKAKAAFDISQNKSIRRDFRRGRLVNNEEGLWVELLSTQDSHMLSGISYGDVLVEIPPQADVKTAQLLNVYPLAGALD